VVTVDRHSRRGNRLRIDGVVLTSGRVGTVFFRFDPEIRRRGGQSQFAMDPQRLLQPVFIPILPPSKVMLEG
jgi:hypothetical protein